MLHPAWRGFANSADKQRLEAFIRRCVLLNFYRQDDLCVTELVTDLDDSLFAILFWRMTSTSMFFIILYQTAIIIHTILWIGVMTLC